MPLVAYALAAYLAGLLAGFSNSILIAAAAISAACLVGALRGGGRAAAIGFAALATGGIVAARQSGVVQRECAARYAVGSSVRLRLENPASPGAFVRARPVDCDGFVSLSVSEGTADAGSIVIADGDIARTDHGLQIRNARVRLVDSPSVLRRIRNASGRSIDRNFRGDAPLAKALLIADMSDLAPEIKNRYSAAGLAHILAISGAHIAIIAAALELALELIGVSKRRASILTIAVSIFYVAMVGAPIPAIRSAVMITALLITRLAQRPTARWAVVAVGAMQPVLDPRVVLDAGYQLSVVGVAALIVSSALTRRIGVDRLPGLLRGFVVTLIASTVATIATAPIVAWIFGRVSIVAPLTNLAAEPIIAVAQPMLFLGLVLGPIGPIGRFIADASHPLLAALDFVAATGAAAPGGSVTVLPTIPAAVVSVVLAGAVLVACASRDWIPPATIAIAAAVLLVWIPFAPHRAGEVELHMIDVGQGDAIAVRTPHSHWILFDAGRAWRGGDAGRSTVLPYLARRGGSLDVFVLSHPHTDHVGGAASVLQAMHPRLYVDAGFPGSADAYRASLDVARSARVKWVRAHPNDSLLIDGVSIKFLAPDSSWTASLDDPNLASVVALVRVGDVRMLFMGDAERAEEEWLLKHAGADLHADILKVGHHGSRTSSTAAFLDSVRPRLALVSVGEGNMYHLPTPSIMHDLAARGAQVLRTDRLGTIVARTDGHQIIIEAAGDTWELSPQSAPP